MSFPKNRKPYGTLNPYRTVRPKTSKIIFLSLEGSVTEEMYFDRVMSLFEGIKSKIQFISVAEDAVHTIPRYRTPEQNTLLSKVRPKQLLERIDRFKEEKDDIYQFSKYPDDEFWIVVDVDKNWSDEKITTAGKRYIDEWNEMIKSCTEKKYNYAVSNPFFEIWLLLHHDDATDEDKSLAVTDENEYKKEVHSHFSERLRELRAPLRGNNNKEIDLLHYDQEKIENAVRRAKELHIDKNDLSPKYFSTTVYILLEKIFSLLPQNVQESE